MTGVLYTREVEIIINEVRSLKKEDQVACISLQAEDFKAAIKGIQSYVDITDEDLMNLYLMALDHAKRRMTGGMPASEVMTRTVISVHTGETLESVLEILMRHNISGLPVLDAQNRVVGVISEADFVQLLSNDQATGASGKIFSFFRKEHTYGITAADAMSTPAITRSKETSIKDIASMMIEKKVNRVPIVDKDGRLLGIVTRSDIVKALNMKGNE
ncbi:MAG: CBS domain-containing protein [Bacillota bacterium]